MIIFIKTMEPNPGILAFCMNVPNNSATIIYQHYSDVFKAWCVCQQCGLVIR